MYFDPYLDCDVDEEVICQREQSPLLRLPPELRLVIYEYTFTTNAANYDYIYFLATPPHGELTLANKQVYRESNGLWKEACRRFWSQTRFRIRPEHESAVFARINSFYDYELAACTYVDFITPQWHFTLRNRIWEVRRPGQEGPPAFFAHTYFEAPRGFGEGWYFGRAKSHRSDVDVPYRKYGCRRSPGNAGNAGELVKVKVKKNKTKAWLYSYRNIYKCEVLHELLDATGFGDHEVVVDRCEKMNDREKTVFNRAILDGVFHWFPKFEV